MASLLVLPRQTDPLSFDGTLPPATLTAQIMHLDVEREHGVVGFDDGAQLRVILTDAQRPVGVT